MKKLLSKPFLAGSLIAAALILLTIFSLYLLNSDKKHEPSKVRYPQSYKDLYNYLKEEKNRYLVNQEYTDATTSNKGGSNYSKTNIQVLGVDEADIVKTDGSYIYAIVEDYLYIIKAENGNLEISSKISAKTSDDKTTSYYSEMYLKDNYLIIIKKYNQYYDLGPMEEGPTKIMPEMYFINNQELAIVIYDITDKTNPVLTNELSQSGSYVSSRMINDNLYVITNHYVYGEILPDDATTYVPILKGTETKPVAINDILIAPNANSSSYLTITGLDIKNADDFISSKAVLGSSSNIYADSDNIYIAGYGSVKEGNTYVSKTDLMKFSTVQGQINLVATGVVNGNILNQFSMDEYNGNFRIVTTSNDYTFTEKTTDDSITIDNQTNQSKNNLYVLNKDLNVISKIEGLAEGEQVYSVRFDNEIAYFVTFKRTDPLFVVDLSNPTNPVIKSELKIPGFSEYLHVYNEKYLFGLGKEADLEGRVTGLKISMFDIQNKSDVTEKYKLILGDNSFWSEASYNHKAILVSNENNLIGFPVENKYVIYKFIDNVGFEKLGQVEMDYFNEYGYYYGSTRGLYIDDFFYVISQYQIKSFNLTSFEPTSSLNIYLPKE